MAPVNETELVARIGEFAEGLIRDTGADALSCNDPLRISRMVVFLLY